MKNELAAIFLVGLVVAACNVDRKPAADKADFAQSGTATGLALSANTESGEVELKLPGGFEGKLRLPDGLKPQAKFELDDIGRCPGARLVSINVKAAGSDDQRQTRVELAFTAPGSAERVADWYEQAFAARGRPLRRTGTTLVGTTKEGNPLQMVLSQGLAGNARGHITIIENQRDS